MIKGWVTGLDVHHLLTAYREIDDLIKAHDIGAISWDGDLLHQSSFTAIIPKVVEANPHLHVYAYKKSKSIHKLNNGFAEVDDFGNDLRGYDFFFADPDDRRHPTALFGDMKWYELGIRAMEHLVLNEGFSSIYVFCVGKGAVIDRELQSIQANELLVNRIKHFHIMRAARINPRTHSLEICEEEHVFV